MSAMARTTYLVGDGGLRAERRRHTHQPPRRGSDTVIKAGTAGAHQNDGLPASRARLTDACAASRAPITWDDDQPYLRPFMSDRQRFGVRDSNGHARRAHDGLALDSRTRRLDAARKALQQRQFGARQVRIPTKERPLQASALTC
jgi:hypothetical protein